MSVYVESHLKAFRIGWAIQAYRYDDECKIIESEDCWFLDPFRAHERLCNLKDGKKFNSIRYINIAKGEITEYTLVEKKVGSHWRQRVIMVKK